MKKHAALWLAGLLAPALSAPGFAQTATNAPAVVYSQNQEANDLFLKGREFYAKSDPRSGGKLANAREAIKLYEAAIAKDPKFALAYVEMSRAWLQLGYSDPDRESDDVIIAKSHEALLKAVALDADLAEAHIGLASVYYNLDYDWEKAGQEYQQALRLKPNDASVHTSYASYLGSMGRFDEALAEIKKAEAIAPSITTKLAAARIYYSKHDYDPAIAACNQALAIKDHVIGHLYLGFSYVAQGRYDEAVKELEKTASFSNNGGAWASLAYGYAMAGRQDEARKLLDEILVGGTRGGVVHYRIAAVYLALGDKDQAISWLEKDYARHGAWMAQLKVDPVMDPLRSDPRFMVLMRKVGFDQG